MKKQNTKIGATLDSLARYAESLLADEQRGIKGGDGPGPTYYGGMLNEVVITASPLPSGSGSGSFSGCAVNVSRAGEPGSKGYGWLGLGQLGTEGLSNGGGVYGAPLNRVPGGGGSYKAGTTNTPAAGKPKAGNEWLEPASTINGAVGVVASAAEHFPEMVASAIKSISKADVTQVAKATGFGTILVEAGIDAIGVYNYYNQGSNSVNAISPAKAGLSLGVTLWSSAGVVNAIAGGLYFGIDKLYPGGTEGALKMNNELTQKNQAVLGKYWNLNRDY